MPKFLTSGAQKLMENYIKSTGCKGAIYDEEMKLLWTNYPKYFDNFDLKTQCGERPLTSDSSFSLELDVGQAVLGITPVYKSSRIISAYVCIIRESYDIFKMINKTVISDFSDNIMQKSCDRLQKLAELNSAIGESVMELGSLCEPDGPEKLNNVFKELDKLIEKQKEMLSAMKNETEVYIDTCFIEQSDEDLYCNITLLLSAACAHVAESFKEIGRKVKFTVEDKKRYIPSEGRSLLLGFLHLLRAHVVLSPHGSSVSITVSVESAAGNSDYLCVKIKTLLLPGEEAEKSEEAKEAAERLLLTSHAYRELAKKVVMYDYNGEFMCSDTKKYMQTIFKIPVGKKNRGPKLESDKLMYGSRALTYLNNIMYWEKNGET